MKRDETVDLWKRCEEVRAAAIAEGQSEEAAHEGAKNIWNTWAKQLLEERRELEGKGRWQSSCREFDLRPGQKVNTYGLREVGGNPATQRWLENAACDFSEFRFDTKQVEQGAIESSSLDSRDFGWVRGKVFQHPRFDEFIFPSSCDFWAATFLAPANFSGAVFHGFAGFRRTTFENIVWFNETSFKQTAWFSRARFASLALFENAHFHKLVRFTGAIFDEDTNFEDSLFSGETIFFGCSFSRRLILSRSTFVGKADFNAISVAHSFFMSRAKFSEVPAFSQANFKQTPDLDDVQFPLPGFWGWGEADVIPKYRALRRMAIQSADYEREQMAFKGEIRSKRGTEHKWYHAAFWYGLAYDALSDFGRSMSRPSLIWFLSIAVFALFYLASSGKLGSAFADCPAARAPNFESALIISWKNALPLIGIDAKAEEIARSCLYGIDAYGGIAIQGLQKVWSAVLLFLLLLALRNQFKIK